MCIADLHPFDIYAAHGVLTGLSGVASIFRDTMGYWDQRLDFLKGARCLPRFFVALLPQLYDQLAANNYGIDIVIPDGTVLRIILLAFIDDLLLLSSSPAKYRRSMLIVSA